MQNATIGAFCNNFDLHFAKSFFFGLLFEWPFYTGFTVLGLGLSLEFGLIVFPSLGPLRCRRCVNAYSLDACTLTMDCYAHEVINNTVQSKMLKGCPKFLIPNCHFFAHQLKLMFWGARILSLFHNEFNKFNNTVRSTNVRFYL